MDLLSLVAQVTKRKGDLFSQAQDLAKKTQSLNKLEEMMEGQSKEIVGNLRDGRIRWEEYERSLVEQSIISALASAILGSSDNSQRVLDKSWPIIIGDMLPPLHTFLSQTQISLELGLIEPREGDTDFEESSPKRMSWGGLLSRVMRYLSTPTYSFFQLGNFFNKSDQGYKEMRRIAVLDQKTCEDCKHFSSLGWQTLGSLPMPGRECRCYDRCRCRIEYR